MNEKEGKVGAIKKSIQKTVTRFGFRLQLKSCCKVADWESLTRLGVLVVTTAPLPAEDQRQSINLGISWDEFLANAHCGGEEVRP